jgi:hypothetical protein
LPLPPIHEEPVEGQGAITNAEDPRAFIMECIKAMSREELLELKLPAAVLFRLSRRQGPSE